MQLSVLLFYNKQIGNPASFRKQKTEKNKKLEAARNSKAVKAFNEEGNRKFCELCCKTIYDALLEGEVPPASSPGGYDELPNEMLLSFILEHCKPATCDYSQAFFGVYKADEFDNSSMFLYKAMDRHGVEHSFALTASEIPYPEGDMGISFRALEVHKLTKAGRTAAGNTDTDYDIDHFKMCRDGDDSYHTALVGLVELIEKITDVIRTESLLEFRTPASNHITINGRHYSISSIGTIMPVYVGEAENCLSMRDRAWDGSEYGFLIDGKLFTGNELALMFSNNEGAQISSMRMILPAIH